MLVHIRNLSTGAVWLRIDGPRVTITPKRNYEKKKKTVKEHSGKVAKVCIKLHNDIYSLSTPATHLDLCQRLNIDIDEVEATGWLLENGNYVWR